MYHPPQSAVRAILVSETRVESIFTFENEKCIARHVATLLGCESSEIRKCTVSKDGDDAKISFTEWIARLELNLVCCSQRHAVPNMLLGATLWRRETCFHPECIPTQCQVRKCVRRTVCRLGPDCVLRREPGRFRLWRDSVAVEFPNSIDLSPLNTIWSASPEIKAYRDNSFRVKIDMAANYAKLVKTLDTIPIAEEFPVSAQVTHAKYAGEKHVAASLWKGYESDRNVLDPVIHEMLMTEKEAGFFSQSYHFYFDYRMRTIDCYIDFIHASLQFIYTASFYHDPNELLERLPFSGKVSTHDICSGFVLERHIFPSIFAFIIAEPLGSFVTFEYAPLSLSESVRFDSCSGVMTLFSVAYPFEMSCVELSRGKFETVFQLSNVAAGSLDLIAKVLNAVCDVYDARKAPYEAICEPILKSIGQHILVKPLIKQHRERHPFQYIHILSKMSPNAKYTIYEPGSSEINEDDPRAVKYQGLIYYLDEGYFMDYIGNSMANQSFFPRIPTSVLRTRTNAESTARATGTLDPHIFHYAVLTNFSRSELSPLMQKLDVKTNIMQDLMTVIEGTLLSKSSILHILNSARPGICADLLQDVATETDVEERYTNIPNQFEEIASATRQDLLSFFAEHSYLVACDITWTPQKIASTLESGSIDVTVFRRLLEEFYDVTIVVLDQPSKSKLHIPQQPGTEGVRNLPDPVRPVVVIFTMSDPSEYRVLEHQCQTIVRFNKMTQTRIATHAPTDFGFLKAIMAKLEYVDTSAVIRAIIALLRPLSGTPPWKEFAQLLNCRGQVIAFGFHAGTHVVWVRPRQFVCEPLFDLAPRTKLFRSSLIRADSAAKLLRFPGTMDVRNQQVYGVVFENALKIGSTFVSLYVPTRPSEVPQNFTACSPQGREIGLAIPFDIQIPQRATATTYHHMLCALFAVFRISTNKTDCRSTVDEFSGRFVALVDQLPPTNATDITSGFDDINQAIATFQEESPEMFVRNKKGTQIQIKATKSLLQEFKVCHRWVPLTRANNLSSLTHTILSVVERQIPDLAYFGKTIPRFDGNKFSELFRDPDTEFIFNADGNNFRAFASKRPAQTTALADRVKMNLTRGLGDKRIAPKTVEKAQRALNDPKFKFLPSNIYIIALDDLAGRTRLIAPCAQTENVKLQ